MEANGVIKEEDSILISVSSLGNYWEHLGFVLSFVGKRIKKKEEVLIKEISTTEEIQLIESSNISIERTTIEGVDEGAKINFVFTNLSYLPISSLHNFCNYNKFSEREEYIKGLKERFNIFLYNPKTTRKYSEEKDYLMFRRSDKKLVIKFSENYKTNNGYNTFWRIPIDLVVEVIFLAVYFNAEVTFS